MLPRFEVDERGCWIWQGAKNDMGYGQISDDGKRSYTHRLSYEWFVGPIPDGYFIDHLCRTPACMNPDHLEAVPPRINQIRGNGLAGINHRKTHCPKGHPYSGDNLRIPATRPNARQCVACTRERDRLRSARKFAKV